VCLGDFLQLLPEFRIRSHLLILVFLLATAWIAQPAAAEPDSLLYLSLRSTHGGHDEIRTRVRFLDREVASRGPRIHDSLNRAVKQRSP